MRLRRLAARIRVFPVISYQPCVLVARFLAARRPRSHRSRSTAIETAATTQYVSVPALGGFLARLHSVWHKSPAGWRFFPWPNQSAVPAGLKGLRERGRYTPASSVAPEALYLPPAPLAFRAFLPTTARRSEPRVQ